MSLVFVYGSLKAGFRNAHLNHGVRQPGAFRTCARLPLYLLGDGHVPCLVLSLDSGHQVIGEVYQVSAEALAVMDQLERLGQPDGYLRVPIEVEKIDAPAPMPVTAHAYVKLPEHVVRPLQRIGPLAEYTAAHAVHFKW